MGQGVTDASRSFANLDWSGSRLLAPIPEGDNVYSRSGVPRKLYRRKCHRHDGKEEETMTFRHTYVTYDQEQTLPMLRPSLGDEEGKKV